MGRRGGGIKQKLEGARKCQPGSASCRHIFLGSACLLTRLPAPSLGLFPSSFAHKGHFSRRSDGGTAVALADLKHLDGPGAKWGSPRREA